MTDDLTSLYNSRYLNQVLRRESKRASRSGRPLSLLFLDLDGFKSVNDRHGHLCGSRALVEAAERHPRMRARNGRRRRASAATSLRVVLPDTGSEGAVAVAERVRERIARALVPQGQRRARHSSDGVGRRGDAARCRGLG